MRGAGCCINDFFDKDWTKKFQEQKKDHLQVVC